jgi:hypothetical protein
MQVYSSDDILFFSDRVLGIPQYDIAQLVREVADLDTGETKKSEFGTARKMEILGPERM